MVSRGHEIRKVLLWFRPDVGQKLIQGCRPILLHLNLKRYSVVFLGFSIVLLGVNMLITPIASSTVFLVASVAAGWDQGRWWGKTHGELMETGPAWRAAGFLTLVGFAWSALLRVILVGLALVTEMVTVEFLVEILLTPDALLLLALWVATTLGGFFVNRLMLRYGSQSGAESVQHAKAQTRSDED